jgi:hypothetical protein
MAHNDCISNKRTKAVAWGKTSLRKKIILEYYITEQVKIVIVFGLTLPTKLTEINKKRNTPI